MNKKQLIDQIKQKRSLLCIGLDSDVHKIPWRLINKEDSIFEFNKQIVDATHHLAIAFKPNIAFYESNGSKGWETLEKTVEYIKENYPDIFLIADAKRGDIGNTSTMYAKAFFEKLSFDAITVTPYMGSDSIIPFLKYDKKWIIVLALTSNKGAEDFQLEENKSGIALFEKVLSISKNWGTNENMMYVVGATKAQKLKEIRIIIPNHFILVPGIGAQGGNLSEVMNFGLNDEIGLLINSSRSIIYASSTEDFALSAKIEAEKLQQEMEHILVEKNYL
ncbi:orotidine-5'-phosphate decarboxylase [Bacteroidota bacterium]